MGTIYYTLHVNLAHFQNPSEVQYPCFPFYQRSEQIRSPAVQTTRVTFRGRKVTYNSWSHSDLLTAVRIVLV